MVLGGRNRVCPDGDCGGGLRMRQGGSERDGEGPRRRVAELVDKGENDLADAIREAETPDELKSALVGELTNVQVRGKRPDHAGGPGGNS